MGKRIMPLAVLILSILLLSCTNASAAQMSSVLDTTAIVGFTEYGWVSFDIYAVYAEHYTTAGNVNTFYKRVNQWDVTPSRGGSSAVPSMGFAVTHHNSNGSTYKTFTMAADEYVSGAIFNGYMSNSESVPYAMTVGNYGTTGFGIGGQGMIWPYTYNDFCIHFGTG